MNAALLHRIGEALYGSRWQSELARDLDVSDRTMRRWVADNPPAGVYFDAREILKRRMKEIAALLAQLPS